MYKQFKYNLWGEDIYFDRKLGDLECLFLSVLSKSDTDFYKKVKDRNNIDSYVKEEIEKLVTVIERKNKIKNILNSK